MTQLPQITRLGPNWEVGLSEFIYTKSWYNITEDQQVYLVDNQGEIHTHPDAFILAGQYEEPEYLIQEINRRVQLIFTVACESRKLEQVECPRLEYSKISKRVRLTVGYAHVKKDQEESVENAVQKSIPFYVNVDNHLGTMLGIDKDYFLPMKNEITVKKLSFEFTSKQIKGEAAPCTLDMNAGVQAIYVYTDIVKPLIVGDTYSQILRVIQVPRGYFGDTIQHIFDRIHYCALNSPEFQTIKIQIKDDAGVPIKF